VDGKADLMKCTDIDLERLEKELRMQRIIFETAGQVYDLTKSAWQDKATKFALIGQVIRLVEDYLASGAIAINPSLWATDPVRQRIILMMNMNKIVRHLWDFIKLEQTESLAPVFGDKKVRSTGDMPIWFTSKPCYVTEHSHISHCVFDSSWEATESYVLDKNPNVLAWVKNDHLGFEVVYVFDGVVRKYYPDFLIKLSDGKTLVLETKGQTNRQVAAKRKALEEWVAAVNSIGEYGQWCYDTSFNVADVDGIIVKHLIASNNGDSDE
jgi:type III restriction enzyme